MLIATCVAYSRSIRRPRSEQTQCPNYIQEIRRRVLKRWMFCFRAIVPSFL
jgi:hypothetical protein